MGPPGKHGGPEELTTDDDADPAGLCKRSVVIAGHGTSVSLELAFWQALKAIAARRHVSVARLIAEVDAGRSGNLSSALRVFILREIQSHTGT